MRKAVYALSVLLLVVTLGFIYFFSGKPAVPRVFQSPYRAQIRAEFETLMADENRNVSEDHFWTTSIKGKTAQGELDKKAAQLAAKYQLLEQKAKENGKSLKPLDLTKADWGTVSQRYTELKQLEIDKVLATVTSEEAEKHYQENLKNYARQATLKGKLAIWKDGIIISQETLEISEENIRIVTETYTELEPLLKDITVDKEVVWSQNGRYYSFSCEEIEEKGVKPFEEVVDAVATQYAEAKVEKWLDENTQSK